MSNTRKKSKRSRSPEGAVLSQSSAWLSPSGLPPELLFEAPNPIDSPAVKKETAATETKHSVEKEHMPNKSEMECSTSSPITVQDSAPTGSKIYSFKDKNFVHSSKGPGGGKRAKVWKTLKQINASDKALPWGEDDVIYGSIDAPPSFKPAKKYSDLSGLPAKYTDPQTKLRYATTDEFARLRVLPSDIVSGYLTLRKANPVVP